MSALGSLVVKLALETAEYSKGLDKNSQEAKAYAKNVQEHFDKAGSAVKGFAMGVGSALVGAFAINGIASFTARTIDAAAALNDLSIASGMSVESLSGLVSVGQYSGQTAESLAAASNKLAKNLAGVDEEGKGSAQAIRALGIDFKSFVNQSPEQRMLTVAKSMSGFADGSEKSAVMMMLFGKQGAAMLPMMQDLAKQVELNAQRTTEQTAAADDLMDTLQKTQVEGSKWTSELVLGMTPALAVAANAFYDVVVANGGLLSKVKELAADGSLKRWTLYAIAGFTGVIDVVELFWRLAKTAATVVVANFTAVGSTVMGVAETFAKFVQGDFKGGMEAWTASTQRTKLATEALGTQLKDTWSEESLGSKLRSRMADLQAVGDTSEASKPKIDLRGVLKGNTDAAKGEKDAFDGLLKKLTEFSLETGRANDQGKELTKTQKLELDMAQAVAAGTVRMTAERAAAWAAAVQQATAVEAHAAHLATEKKRLEDAAKAQEAMWQATIKRTDALQDAISKQIDENAVMGLSQEAIHQRMIARELDNAVSLEAEASILRLMGGNEKMAEQLEHQAALIRQLAGLKGQNYAAKIAQDAADASAKATAAMEADYLKRVEAMGNGLTTAVEGWLVGGKSLFGGLRDWVKQQFASLVLRPMITPIMQGAAGSLVGLLGLGGAGSAMAAPVGGAGGLASLLGIGGSFGGGLAAGFGGLMGSAGSLFGMAGTGASLGGAMSAGSIAIGSGNVMGALGTFAGALGPLALGAMALAGLDKKGGGPKTEGGYSSGGGLLIRSGGVADAEASTSAQAIVTLYNSIMSALGMRAGQMDAAVQFSMDNGQGGDANTQLQLAAALNGRNVFNLNPGYQENIARGSEPLKAAIELNSLRAVVAALKASDLDQAARDYVEGLDHVNGGLDGLKRGISDLTNASRLAQGIEPLGGVFGRIAEMGVAARIGLLDMVGGLDSFLSKSKSFVDNYYTDVERGAIDAQRILGTLSEAGLSAAGLTDKASFRRLLEAQDPSTEAGSQQFAALLNVNQAFAQLAPLLEAQKLTINQLAAMAPGGAITQRLAQSSTSQADAAKAQQSSLDALARIAQATTTAVQDVGRATNAALDAIVLATQATSQHLDDVIRGGASVNTAVAA